MSGNISVSECPQDTDQLRSLNVRRCEHGCWKMLVTTLVLTWWVLTSSRRQHHEQDLRDGSFCSGMGRTRLGSRICPTYGIQPNTIYSGADGKFESAPDTAVLHLDIASQQDTSKAAYDKVAAAATSVRTVLRNNGIEPKAGGDCRTIQCSRSTIGKIPSAK